MLRWCAAIQWIVIAILVAGCAARKAAQRASGAEHRVRHVEIEGNHHLDDEQIREHLHTQQTTWVPLPERHYLIDGLLPVDAERIEELYAAHGHYEAGVLDVQAHEHPRREIVDVVFVVDEGEPTKVTSIQFHWPEGPAAGPRDRRARPETIETHCGLTVDEAFDVEEMHASETTMTEALRARGYAFARVEARAEVDRVAHTARVDFELTPGPFVRIGQVDFKGLAAVPEHLVRAEIEKYRGKPFSPRRLQHMEEAIYALSVFSSVTVTPAEEPRDGLVDLSITVREGKPQKVKLGVGLGLEPNRWEQYGAARYTHENLLHSLTRFDAKLRAGYAELPALYQPREHGPIVVLEPSLRKKGLLEPGLVWTLQPGFELGLQEGYKFYTPSNRVGVSRFFTRFVETGVSHNVRFVDFFAVSPTLDANRSLLGLDFRDPYLLSYVEFEARLHLTDRLSNPRHGAVVGATYDLAGGIFGGHFDYHKVTPEARAYWTPLRQRLQLAARAQVAFIVPFGDEPGAPFDRKLYLGGANTVRGWGQRRLSPYVSSCNDQGECSRVPVGGQTSVLGNFETRVRLWRELWGVAFFDMGDVQPEVATFRPQRWNYAAGPGLRYDSRIGTFRLDVGVRLNDPPQFRHQPRWAVHFGLGETF